jgi:hypothetical protein
VHWTLRRKVVAVVAGLTVLAGGGGAYAVSKGSADGGRQAFLNDVAKRLNVTPQQLESAFQGATSDRLAADVAAGRLTQQQADDIRRHLKEHGAVPFGGPGPGPGPGHFGGPGPGPGPGPGGFGGGPPGPGGPFMAPLHAAATYLGLTDTQLRSQLESGKSLAQVAGDRNKPVAGLKSAIEAAVKTELDKAVTDKRITQADEDRELGELRSRLDNLVNSKPGTMRPRPFGRRDFRGGPHW